MDSTSPSRIFSTVEPLEVEATDRRPVRISVFMALLLGIVSAAAILGKPLVVLPVLTVGVALWALRPSRHGPPVGRWAAVTGMVLAVFFGAWGWTRAEVRQRALVRQATEFAHDWLVTLAEGHEEMALELTHREELRQAEAMPLDVYYATQEQAREAIRVFLEQEEIWEIFQGGKDQKWKPVGRPEVWQRHGADYVSIEWQETSGGPGNLYRTELVREWDEQQKMGRWRLERVAAAE